MKMLGVYDVSVARTWPAVKFVDRFREIACYYEMIQGLGLFVACWWSMCRAGIHRVSCHPHTTTAGHTLMWDPNQALGKIGKKTVLIQDLPQLL